MTDWSKRTWLITGSSTGLGYAIAEAVLAAGGRVIATARDTSSLDALVAAGGDRVIALTLDVTKPDQVAAAIKDGEAAFGGIDVVVNNAGYGFLGGIEESADAEIRDQFEVNFFGLAAVTRAVLPGMRQRRSGYVVNMSSIVGLCGMAAAGWYSSSKFAVEGLSEALLAEAGPLGIKVMLVEPGPFRTDFNGRSLRMPANTIDEYQAAVDTRAFSRTNDGLQPGDPVRAATSLLEAMDSAEPPFRLLLGKLASDMALGIHSGRSEEAAKFRDIAVKADFPEEAMA